MVAVNELLRDEANEAHIAGHEVARHEAVEAVFGADAILAVEDTHRRGRVLVFGVTRAGRHLLVVLDEPTITGSAYVVTARPMTIRERREYEEAQQ